MKALTGLDQVDLVLAAIVIIEQARERTPLLYLRETAYELAHVVAAGDSLQLTHHVILLARQYKLLGHLAVQYAELLNGPNSFTESLSTCTDEQFHALVAAYALDKATGDRDWLRTSWNQEDMAKLVPFMEDSPALRSLTHCQSYIVGDVALLRCVDVMEPEDLVPVLDTCMVRDAAWATAVKSAPLEARRDFAIHPKISFIKRRNAQKTLSTEDLRKLLEVAEPHVKIGIEEELALRV